MTDKPIRNLLLTFDYELFLGAWSGTVDACMLIPTQHIIDILDRYELKSIFFVDATYLLKLKEYSSKYQNARLDFENIQRQLQLLVQKGHSLYLHIHPHWKDAVYHPQKNQWSAEAGGDFSFANLDEQERSEVFSKTHNLLEKIADCGPLHKVDGFRAGGLYIQPVNIFTPHFRKHGIRFDFSLLPGFSSQGPDYGYDFSRIRNKEIYRFNDELAESSQDGEFYEFPISIVRAGIKTKIMNSLWYRLILRYSRQKKWGDGVPTKNMIVSKDKKSRYVLEESASIEMLNIVKIPAYAAYLRDNEFMQFISHPKFISADHLIAFEKFIRKVSLKYSLQTDIRKIFSKLPDPEAK